MKKALGLLDQNADIDLIVLDVMMPEMSGFDVCKKLRKHYAMHELPVVFLTAKTADDAYVEGMEAGGNDFLTKPVSKTLLLPKIASLLRMSEAVND